MRILITGASRGIGRALVKHYVKAGHEVRAGCRNPEVWQALWQRIFTRLSLTSAIWR